MEPPEYSYACGEGQPRGNSRSGCPCRHLPLRSGTGAAMPRRHLLYHTHCCSRMLTRTELDPTCMPDTHRERAPRPREADTPAGAARGIVPNATDLAEKAGRYAAQAELWETQTDATRLAVAPTFLTPAYTVVTEPAALERLLPQLQAALVIGVDTETTGLDPLTDRLRLLQLATADRVIVVDLATIPVQQLAALFAQEREWLVHNGLFDVRFLMAAGLRWSGRLFDTMLMSQLLGAGTPEGNLGRVGWERSSSATSVCSCPRNSNSAVGRDC